MALTRRERLREETTQTIKQIARQQMSENGAAALSLRAIAREMGMSAPALYRYFDNRDALVTELIVDAYSALADALETAAVEAAVVTVRRRFLAVSAAFRQWAHEHSEDFTLIYGTPIPGYSAPRERTVEPAARVLQAFGRIVTEGWRDGQLNELPLYTNLPDDMQAVIDRVIGLLPEETFPPLAVTLSMLLWSRLYGLVWGELYGHFIPGFAESGELYQIEMQAICDQLGFSAEEPAYDSI